MLVVGQEQDEFGSGFSLGEAFVGQITNLEFWGPCAWIFKDEPAGPSASSDHTSDGRLLREGDGIATGSSEKIRTTSGRDEVLLGLLTRCEYDAEIKGNLVTWADFEGNLRGPLKVSRQRWNSLTQT